MTIQSATNRSEYTGSGSTATYSYGFKVFQSSELRVKVKLTSTLVETTLTLTTDYTVTGLGVLAGGNVVLVNASQAWLDGSGFLLSTYTITIDRVMPLTQQTSITSQGDYGPEYAEKQFDRGVMIDQQQQREINQSLKLPITETGSAALTTLPNATDRASKALGFDASGNPTALTVTTVGAPTTATYICVTAQGDLSAERRLQGTANQVVLTDGGANGDLTLSTPQNIHSAATPTFAGMTLNGSATVASGNMTVTSGNTTLTAGDLNVTAGFVKMGATPATVGAIRLTNNTAIDIRNAANNANLTMMTINGSDQMTIGDANAASIGFNCTGAFFLQGNPRLCFTPNTPTILSGNVNNYAIAGTWARLSSDASRNITGMAAPTVSSGQFFMVTNVGAQNIVFTNQDAASTDVNRIITGLGADFTLAADKSVIFIYDATTQRWRLFKNA